MSEKKAVLFDLDGTLINTLQDLADAVETVLREHGFGNKDSSPVHTLEDYRHFVGNGGYKLVERALPHGTAPETVQAIYLRFLEYYDKNFCVKSAPYNGVLPLLDELARHNIPWGIVTNKPEPQAKRLVETLFSDYRVSCVYGGGVAGRAHKPDAEVTNMALRDLHVTAEDTIFVGDSDVDVYTAHNAGMVCAGAVWGFRGEEELREAGAEFLLHQPLDLLQYL